MLNPKSFNRRRSSRHLSGGNAREMAYFVKNDDACEAVDEPKSQTTSEATNDPLIELAKEVVRELKRLANHFDPPPPDVVDTNYIANKLCCTKTWIAELTRNGEIPRNCIVEGTGNGKVWKFHRPQIDAWIASR